MSLRGLSPDRSPNLFITTLVITGLATTTFAIPHLLNIRQGDLPGLPIPAQANEGTAPIIGEIRDVIGQDINLIVNLIPPGINPYLDTILTRLNQNRGGQAPLIGYSLEGEDFGSHTFLASSDIDVNQVAEQTAESILAMSDAPILKVKVPTHDGESVDVHMYVMNPENMWTQWEVMNWQDGQKVPYRKWSGVEYRTLDWNLTVQALEHQKAALEEMARQIHRLGIPLETEDYAVVLFGVGSIREGIPGPNTDIDAVIAIEVKTQAGLKTAAWVYEQIAREFDSNLNIRSALAENLVNTGMSRMDIGITARIIGKQDSVLPFYWTDVNLDLAP